MYGLEWSGSLLLDVLGDVLLAVNPLVSCCIVLFVILTRLLFNVGDFGLIVCDKLAEGQVELVPRR